MTYKVIDIALEIQQDLSLDDISPSAIAFWVRNNIGTLNNLIYTSYALNDSDSEFTTAISIEAIGILKKMYEVYNYDRLIRANLGASAFSSVVEVNENGNKIRLVNKTEMGKVYADLRRQNILELKDLVNSYLIKHSGSTPISVDGIDGSLPTDTFYTHYGYKRGVFY